jgi:hypothetical protein
MVPLCYRSATVNGLKNPACILHAPYCDVQDANEMRTVENAKQNETYERHTGRIRDDSDFKKPPPLGMSSGGDIRIVLFCTLIFYGDVINYPYV